MQAAIGELPPVGHFSLQKILRLRMENGHLAFQESSALYFRACLLPRAAGNARPAGHDLWGQVRRSGLAAGLMDRSGKQLSGTPRPSNQGCGSELKSSWSC